LLNSKGKIKKAKEKSGNATCQWLARQKLRMKIQRLVTPDPAIEGLEFSL
jgi:hypothetical protein